jgi:ribosomal protein S25
MNDYQSVLERIAVALEELATSPRIAKRPTAKTGARRSSPFSLEQLNEVLRELKSEKRITPILLAQRLGITGVQATGRLRILLRQGAITKVAHGLYSVVPRQTNGVALS